MSLPLIVVSVPNLLLGPEATGVVAAGGLPEALSYKDRRCGLTQSEQPGHEDVLIARTNEESFMSTTHTFRSLNQSNPWLNASMWLMLAVAGVLLTGFVAVLNGAIERGDLRRANQIMSGSRLLPDELPSWTGALQQKLRNGARADGQCPGQRGRVQLDRPRCRRRRAHHLLRVEWARFTLPLSTSGRLVVT